MERTITTHGDGVKITVVITARPSYARVQTALTALRSYGVDVSIVCVASALLPKYGEVSKQILADGWPITWTSYSQIDGDHGAAMARTMGLTTLDLATLFQQTRPDCVMTIADRHETLATAVAASYQDVPLVHIQGGECTGSIDNKVRNAVTALADLHLVSTQDALQRLSRQAVGHIVVTGCPSIDLALAVDDQPLTSLPGTGAAIDLEAGFLLVLQHPDTETADQATFQIAQTQAAIDAVGIPAVWFWPNSDSGSDAVSKQLRIWSPRVPVHFCRQVPPQDFIRLMRQCAVMMGNSSAGIREGSALGVPVVNIGDRQQGRTRGTNAIDVGYHADQIYKGIQRWRMGTRIKPERSTIYGDGKAGPRIAEALLAWWQQIKKAA